MNFYFIIFFVFIVAVSVMAYYLWRRQKSIALNHSLSMALYEVSFPRAKKEEGKVLKDLISMMEQFYSGMSGLKSPYALEMVSPATENETNFYIALPRELSSFFEQQLRSVFPTAEIREEKSDYNIFKYNAPSAGAVASLKHPAALPLKTYEELGVDALEVIANVFSGLIREKEGAAMQIIVSPKADGFKERVKKAIKLMQSGKSLEAALGGANENRLLKTFLKVLSGETIHEEAPKGAPVSVDEKIIGLLNQKISKPVMSVNIRLMASAQTQEVAQKILNEMKSIFSQFTNPQGNYFVLTDLRGRALKKLFYYFSFRLFKANRSIYLNTAELTSLFHFPSHQMFSPKMKFANVKKAEPPGNLSPEGILLGQNSFRDVKTDIRISVDDRRRHFYTIGQTGAGKSALLENMAVQDIKNGAGVCFIDPHGESIEKILGQIPQERWEDVIYFNPGDINRPLGLNMLEYDPRFPEQKTFIVNELLEIFRKLYPESGDAMGPMFEQYFRNSTLLVMEHPESGNTLLEISRVMSDADFRQFKLAHSQNPVINNFWIGTAEKTGGEASLQNMVPYITSKFDTFLANDIMRPIIAQEKSAFNLRDIMDNGKILLINLSKGKLGETNAYLLGMILVGRIFMAALSRANMPEAERKDFYLYIDEFQNVTTKSIAMILSEARKYRLSLIIANQFIGQLQEEIKKAIFGNIGSMAVFRIGKEDAEFLAKHFEPVFSEEDLMNMPNYQAYVKLLIKGATVRPFNIETIAPGKSDPEVSQKIKEISVAKYGRPLSEIESEISKRYLKNIA